MDTTVYVASSFYREPFENWCHFSAQWRQVALLLKFEFGCNITHHMILPSEIYLCNYVTITIRSSKLPSSEDAFCSLEASGMEYSPRSIFSNEGSNSQSFWNSYEDLCFAGSLLSMDLPGILLSIRLWKVVGLLLVEDMSIVDNDGCLWWTKFEKVSLQMWHY